MLVPRCIYAASFIRGDDSEDYGTVTFDGSLEGLPPSIVTAILLAEIRNMYGADVKSVGHYEDVTDGIEAVVISVRSERREKELDGPEAAD